MTDHAIEDEMRELACMSPKAYPLYAALLRQIDAARRERDEALALADEIRVRLDAAIAEVGEHSTNLSASHYDPADGDPYKDSGDSYREDVELLAEAFSTEHDENTKGGE